MDKKILLMCKRCDIFDIQKIKLKMNERFFTTRPYICLSEKMACIFWNINVGSKMWKNGDVLKITFKYKNRGGFRNILHFSEP